MPYSKLDIINFAFNILNKNSVSDLINSGEFSQIAEKSFDLLYETEIAGFSWRFATKLFVLEKTLDEPILNLWRYIYKLPDDYLALVTIYPRSPFELYRNEKLYSNQNSITIEYRSLPDITHLPAYFVNYFSVLLAHRFAYAVANDMQIADRLEKQVIDLRGQALFIDSQSHPSQSMRSRPLLDVRFTGGYGYYIFRGGNI